MNRLRKTVHVTLLFFIALPMPRLVVTAQEADLRQIAERNAAFGFDLYRQLSGTEGNLFLSPYSISTALAMTWAGARGRTAIEMAEVLHFPSEQSTLHHSLSGLQNHLGSINEQEQITLRLANSLWYQEDQSFLESFLDVIEENYGAVLFPVDFRHETEAVRRAINAWVEDETEERIRELITPGLLDPVTSLVLCNAIYFKGLWAFPFDPDQTREAAFHISADRSVEVPMMTGEPEVRTLAFEGFRALELPYHGDDLSMVFMVPDREPGLAGLESALSGEQVSRWMRELGEVQPSRTIIRVPRFSTSSRFELAEVLEAMGMPAAFHNADFSGMTGSRGSYIDEVVHQTWIEVTEEGTEAAAATAVVMKRGGAMFMVDRPFLFLIRENGTGSILFIGRITDPTA